MNEPCLDRVGRDLQSSVTFRNYILESYRISLILLLM